MFLIDEFLDGKIDEWFFYKIVSSDIEKQTKNGQVSPWKYYSIGLMLF